MSNRLFVGNLSFQTTEDDLQQVFQDFGPVSEIRLVLDRDTGRSRGFAFVVMADDEAARKAIYRHWLARAYEDFVHSSGVAEKVFAVFHHRPLDGGGKSSFVPIDKAFR